MLLLLQALDSRALLAGDGLEQLTNRWHPEKAQTSPFDALHAQKKAERSWPQGKRGRFEGSEDANQRKLLSCRISTSGALPLRLSIQTQRDSPIRPKARE